MNPTIKIKLKGVHMHIRTLFLDMDGVIVDFHRAVLERHGIKEVSNLHEWEFLYRKDFGMSCDEFWLDKDDEFWADLPFTKEAGDIFQCLGERDLLDRVCLLSQPQRHAFQGKVDWIKKNLGRMFNQKQFLLGFKKDWCAHPQSLLIDDNEEHCEDFVAAGGHAFLVPRPWNFMREREGSIVELLGKYLDLHDIRGSNAWKKSNRIRLGNK